MALGESYGRGAMTNHWVDIKNADVILIMGSNAAENHPIAMKWVEEARKKGAKVISIDPRFTRTSAKADIYAPLRSGTDNAFLGGMINYAIQNGKYNKRYVEDCTNALFLVNTDLQTCRHPSHPGTFSHDTSWDYQYYSPDPEPAVRRPMKTNNLNNTSCVFQKLKEQFSIYTPGMVEKICGTPRALFIEICKTFIDGTYSDEKSGTILYAMGWTQHTNGSQIVRAASILQLLLGNVGVAGGGINALRGWHNVQGATDMAYLQHYITGYNTAPIGNSAHSTLSVYLTNETPVTKQPQGMPTSGNWWSNRNRYVKSMLKAWWPDADNDSDVTDDDTDASYQFLPKRKAGKDYTYLSLINDIGNPIKLLFVWGSNPLVVGPDQLVERAKFKGLDMLVVCDLFETETSNFWTLDTTCTTEVYLLPGAAFYEKKGSVTNSGRLVQWKDKACEPPGDAKDELEIITDIGKAIQSDPPGLVPQPITRLNWPYDTAHLGSDLTEDVAKELNGYALSSLTSVGSPARSYSPYEQLDNFFALQTNGTTACGNWLYCGTWQDTTNPRTGNKNQMLNRRPVDDHPCQIGIYRDWGYAWPVNRRIIYNRASVYQSGPNMGKPLAGDVYTTGPNAGKPIPGSKWVVWWNGSNWNGECGSGQANDVVDGYSSNGPDTRLPFIMKAEGLGRLMGIKALVDGPFPEHYEPRETPLTQNPLTNLSPGPPWDSSHAPLWDPCIFDYGKLLADPGSSEYNIIATTYRLTEHWHGGGLTRNLPYLCELMPEPFIEMSEELASTLGVDNGQYVNVYSARNPKGSAPPVTLKVCKTKRFKPFTIDGNVYHQVGIVWHWGYVGLVTGASANILTPYIGDANTRIPETKVFLVKIEKA